MSLAADSRESGVIAQVQRALADSALAASFAPLLYARNGFDEAGAPALAWLAGNTRAALAFITDKPQGTHKLSIRSAPGAAEAHGATIIEILNDDMPFLVDSIMGELQARGLQVRWLLHPIFKTKRDRNGKLLALLGPGDQNWNDGRQESYISIQLPSLPEAQRATERGAVDIAPTSPGGDDGGRSAEWIRPRQLDATRRGVPPPSCGKGVALLRGSRGKFTSWAANGMAIRRAGEGGVIAVGSPGRRPARPQFTCSGRRELVDRPEIARYAEPAALMSPRTA